MDGILLRDVQFKYDKYTSILNATEPTYNYNSPILRSEVVSATQSLKSGKSPRVDNITIGLLKSGGENMISVIINICNKIWNSWDGPIVLTQSLIICIHKKGNIQKCKNYRTISLISHISKIMLKVILRRLQPITEELFSEEQAGFRAGRSTKLKIFNIRIIQEKYTEHQKPLYHIFIDFKKAFDRIWHAGHWEIKKFNINARLIKVIQSSYEKVISAIYYEGKATRTCVRQVCLLSPTLFNIMLEQIMNEDLLDYKGTVSIGERVIINLRFADDIDGLAGSKHEFVNLMNKIDSTSRTYGMEINTNKTKIMTHCEGYFNNSISLHGEIIESVDTFKFLGTILDDNDTKEEILSRIAHTTASLTKLNPIWNDRNVTLNSKMCLLNSLVISIFLYACEMWTISKELQRRITAMDFICIRRLLKITYKDIITNKEVRNRFFIIIGNHKDLLSKVKERKLWWYGRIILDDYSMSKIFLQATVNGIRKTGCPRLTWSDNIHEWTGLNVCDAMRPATDREKWRKIMRDSSAPLRLNAT